MQITETIRPYPLDWQDKRSQWIKRRELRELKNYFRWEYYIQHLFSLAEAGLQISPLYVKGRENALNIQVREIEYSFANLPISFDGYQILFISDPHFDSIEEFTDSLIRIVSPLKPDSVFFGGDYRNQITGGNEVIEKPFQKLLGALKPKDGFYAVLGNHDGPGAVPILERLGVSVLIDESVSIFRNGERMVLTGTDDVHFYFSKNALRALDTPKELFKIALIHSAELADVAESHGYSLYLCGHTHGGQICTRNEKPILTNLSRFKEFCRGSWQYQTMKGYTSVGAGVSGLPLRYNCKPEVLLLTLRQSPTPSH